MAGRVGGEGDTTTQRLMESTLVTENVSEGGLGLAQMIYSRLVYLGRNSATGKENWFRCLPPSLPEVCVTGLTRCNRYYSPTEEDAGAFSRCGQGEQVRYPPPAYQPLR